MDEVAGLPVVGIVGGGHLARMVYRAATALGQSPRILSPAHCDLADLREFAEGCDAITIMDDRVPPAQIAALLADGLPVFPGDRALTVARDRRAMLVQLKAMGVAGAETRLPTGGAHGREYLVAMVARSPFGQVATWPIVEVTSGDAGSVEAVVPAQGVSADQAVEAQRLAIDLAMALGVVGCLAVEYLWTPTGPRVLALVMRPHDAGYPTVEGARTSQFEQHLRAVLDYPLGDTLLTAPVVATATVVARGQDGIGMSLDERLHHLFAMEPCARIHLYGVQPRDGETIGHVTVLGDDCQDVRVRAARAARWLRGGHDG